MAETLISVKNLRKSFGDLEVLKDISMDIHQGEVVCIIGPSGSGKSTLLRCINQLETPTCGEVMYKGENVLEDKADIRKFREEVGMVFQRFNLFPLKTVLGNVALAPVLTKHKTKKEAREYAMELLKRVGLESKAEAKPDMLSGGQQQRVAVARAIAAAPPVILADEPTGNLDTRSTKDVMQILHNLKDDGRTVIVITHDNEIAEQAERVVRIRDGKVVEDYINPGFEEKYGRKAKMDNKNPIDLG